MVNDRDIDNDVGRAEWPQDEDRGERRHGLGDPGLGGLGGGQRGLAAGAGARHLIAVQPPRHPQVCR